MDGIFVKLRKVLERQLATQETLLDYMMQTRGAVISGKSEDLSRIVQSELSELSKMKTAEKERLALMPEVAKALGIDAEASFETLLNASPPDVRAELEPVTVKLRDVTLHLAEMNASNKKLIECQLEYAEAMMNLYIVTDDPLNNMYGEDGRYLEDDLRIAGYINRNA